MFKKNESFIDIMGIVSSVTCMLHCIINSLLIAFLPYYSGIIAGSDLAHQVIALIAVFFCLTSLYKSYRKTFDKKSMIFFVIGMSCLLTTAFLLPEHMHERYEIYILSLGSLALISGHIRHIRLLSQCC